MSCSAWFVKVTAKSRGTAAMRGQQSDHPPATVSGLQRANLHGQRQRLLQFPFRSFWHRTQKAGRALGTVCTESQNSIFSQIFPVRYFSTFLYGNESHSNRVTDVTPDRAIPDSFIHFGTTASVSGESWLHGGRQQWRQQTTCPWNECDAGHASRAHTQGQVRLDVQNRRAVNQVDAA
jgi:hypothetical protein